jgi:putative endonuclease
VSENRRQLLGRRGERVAAAYLSRRGYTVLAHNARTRRGEIDLIALDRDALVFVEIKTRRVAAAQHTLRPDQRPLAGLGPRQRVRLRGLAAAWLQDPQTQRPHTPTIRFDAVGVVIDSRDRLREIEHLEGAW